ncbi:hypothetical protein PGT21_003385 [Puccinia graminis f. sp. tritici]|uniref:Uncharacterized protein n=1 Tax=Puccinia graminis f. sp. tritici TaxID=56615 RepID=A0A5B0PH87_PUCGR|nr:hypothetical protein PGT21_003385 [Puccinia graminis f. sp. tritici]
MISSTLNFRINCLARRSADSSVPHPEAAEVPKPYKIIWRPFNLAGCEHFALHFSGYGADSTLPSWSLLELSCDYHHHYNDDKYDELYMRVPVQPNITLTHHHWVRNRPTEEETIDVDRWSRTPRADHNHEDTVVQTVAVDSRCVGARSINMTRVQPVRDDASLQPDLTRELALDWLCVSAIAQDNPHLLATIYPPPSASLTVSKERKL